MARRRLRIRFKGPQGPSGSLEWLGFADGGVNSNLDTTTTFELVPPAGASGVVEKDLTVLRIVGDISISAQTSVVASSAVGMMIGVRSVGRDQVIDEAYVPLSTDPDDLDNSVMWKFVAANFGAHLAIADQDVTSVVVPVDITVKRKMSKRDTLVLTIQAEVTARKRAAVNLRTLIRVY